MEEKAEQLVLEYMDYAKKLAKSFYRKWYRLGIDLDDLEASAMLGLCEAASRFDEKSKTNFSTFSYFRIRGAMYDFLGRSHINSRKYFHILQGGMEDEEGEESLENEKEKEEEKKYPYAVVFDRTELADVVGSIDNLNLEVVTSEKGIDTDIVYRDSKSPEEELLEEERAQFLRRLVSELSDVERRVIHDYYYKDMVIADIIVSLGGKSRSYVSRKHRDAIDSIKIAAFVHERTEHLAVAA